MTTYIIQTYDSTGLFPEGSTPPKALPDDSLTVCPSGPSTLPFSYLPENDAVVGELVFTVVFMAVFAFVRIRSKNLIPNLAGTVLQRKKAEGLLGEGIFTYLPFYLLLLVLSSAVIGTSVSYILHDEFIGWHTLACSSALILLHFLSLTVARLMGWTFNASGTAAEITANLWCFNIMEGLAVSPFIIAMFFVNNHAITPMLKIVIIGVIILAFLKIVRIIAILISRRVFILYMILYLCAFEIIPLLVLYKIMV